jgi:hypothetical protein
MFTASRLVKVLLGLALFLCLYNAKAATDITKLPDDARTALMREQDFTIIKKIDLIPKEALQALIKSQGLDEFRMADPGKPFQATDAVSDESLPWRQFQFAALSKDYLLIRYSKGGYAFRDYVVLLGRNGVNYRFVWKAMCPCTDFQDFIQALKSGDRIYDQAELTRYL